MPRQSAAALALVQFPKEEYRPDPPPELSSVEKTIWVNLVAALPSDWFKPESHQILIEYCQHVVRSRQLAALLRKTTPRRDLNLYERLSTLAERETKAVVLLATKMRITNQSRWQPNAAAVRANDPNRRRDRWSAVA